MKYINLTLIIALFTCSSTTLFAAAYQEFYITNKTPYSAKVTYRFTTCNQESFTLRPNSTEKRTAAACFLKNVQIELGKDSKGIFYPGEDYRKTFKTLHWNSLDAEIKMEGDTFIMIDLHTNKHIEIEN